ncbi:MAG TPA: hypothetical protein VIZ68_06010 [Thermoplasmata archaeon]
MRDSSGDRPGAEELLMELAAAVQSAGRPVREIEVGIALSIALGRRRAAVSCGGCSTPLEFQGIPARTNSRLSVPFHLVLSDASAT